MTLMQDIRLSPWRLVVGIGMSVAFAPNVLAGFVNVVGDQGDGGVEVNGIAVNLSDPDFRPGTGGDIIRGQAAIYFFELPTLAAGSTISNVELKFQYLGLYVDTFFSVPEFNLDLFGINARPNPIIEASDYYDGTAGLSSDTLIQSSVVTQSTVAGSIAVSNSSLQGFVQSLYNSDGSPISTYAAFRLNPDVELPVNSGLRRGYLVATADHSDESFRPVLSLSTVTPVPEPASIAMWGFGALGLVFARRKRRQKNLAA